MSMAGISDIPRGGSERRRETRQNVPQLVIDSPAAQVDLIDASSRGLGIEVERPLRIGVIYPFRLRRADQTSEVYGLVRWCEAAERRRFRAGISIGKTIGPPLSHLAS